jgi:hypothetical protein
MNELIYIIAWFILPLIPAFLLFKFLPSTGEVENGGKGQGPLKGMGIKFGGAFAGYIALFLISYKVMNDRMKKKDDSREVWTIKGNIISQDNKFTAQEQKPALKIDPQGQNIRNKTFDVQIIATADVQGYLTFPKVDLITLSYQSEPLPELDFNKTKKNIDTSNYVIESLDSKIIRLKKPVVLKSNFQPLPDVTHPDETIVVDTALSHN